MLYLVTFTVGTFTKNNIEISYMSDNDLAVLKKDLITEFDDFWNYETLETEVHRRNNNLHHC